MNLHAVWDRDDVRTAFAAAHGRRSLPSALLLHGPAGVGKQRLAFWLGQLLLCEAPRADGPCEDCRGCRMALRLEHPDLHWFFPLPRPKRASGPDRLAAALEEARGEVLEVVRKAPLRPTFSDEPTGIYLAAVRTLRRMALRRPSMGPRQVFVIGDAQQLVSQEASDQAANALLKLLEEPPEGTYLVLTSSEPGRLLPTIRSRTFPYHLGPLSTASVERFLVEVGGAPSEDAQRAATLSQGSIGRALGFLPVDGHSGPLEKIRQDARDLLEAGVDGERGSAFAAGGGFGAVGARGLLDLFASLEEWLRDLAAVAVGTRALNDDAQAFLEEAVQARNIHPVGVARAVTAVEHAKFLAAGNVNPQLLVHGVVHDMAVALETRT